MQAAARPPVVVDRVHKRFEIPREQVNTLKERALHPLRRSPTDTLQALRDVSFAVRPGEFFGIVGRNGSGKSTLLKCLAGIYGVDSGGIYINGRVSTFIELGVGFNPDLPARDNVMLNATMLGLSPREANRRFDSVVEFAELEDFVDLKVKNYSSGMLVRLAFSVMIHVDAEILLIDEVLAVGDAAFQQKCYEEFERIRRSNATVLLVTHDMGAVQRFCDRAMLLEHGRTVVLGDPEAVGNRYLELNFSEEARQVEEAAAAAEQEGATASVAHQADVPAQGDGSSQADTAAQAEQQTGSGEPAAGQGQGDGAAEIVDAWFEDEQGNRTELLRCGQPCAVAATVRFSETVEDPLFAINIQNSHRDHLLSASNMWSEPRCGTFRAGEIVTFKIRFDNVLAPDRYYVTPAVARHGGAWIARQERMISAVVTGTRRSEGLVQLPYELSIERGAAHAAAPELAR